LWRFHVSFTTTATNAKPTTEATMYRMFDTLPHAAPSDEELPATTGGGGDACVRRILTPRESTERERERANE
jgi:hypothetical protein